MSDERREWMELVAELRADNERLRAERDAARQAAGWLRRALLSEADIRLHRYWISAEQWKWLAEEEGDT